MNEAPLGAGALIWCATYREIYGRDPWTHNLPLPREFAERWACLRASRLYYARIDACLRVPNEVRLAA